ncbi:MAG TPA: TlpA disulfide reductase family protein [Actinophytocola sp.]|uniref:TlpA family protein disulfide reductase n=1 Tax=Actinophytocola sp. TaxID=1872138 RepID=UPI002DBAEA5D|nr:TlpA disulfide reductase family protein [Actinophytocola sp.]HEU5471926.1 TlpA disulfide reductase family protein [Actinophytocola sp.]
MSNRQRWLLAGLIVVVAAVVALWPRSDPPNAGPAGPPAAEPPDLSTARASAALTPCAQTEAPAAVPSGPAELSGVSAECLADGSRVDLAALLSGRAVLVNVWATWCEPCREELPLLAEYAAAPDALPVVGLAVRSDPAGALRLLTELRVRFPNLVDQQDAALRALRVPDALPASYLVGPDGSVHLITDPRVFRSVESVRQTVAHYLPRDGNGSS